MRTYKIHVTFPRRYQRPANRQTQRDGVAVRSHVYRDERGRPYYKAIKFEDGSWAMHALHPISGLVSRRFINGIRRVILYRLPGLIAADPTRPLFVCEGEKDADTLVAQGLVATSAPMGAGKWHLLDESMDEVLRGRRVVIVPDNDAAGKAHAEQVVEALAEIAAEIRLISLPSGVKDVSEFFEAGGTKARLLRRNAVAVR